MRAARALLAITAIGLGVSLAQAQTPPAAQPSEGAAAGQADALKPGRPIVNGRKLQPTPETSAEREGSKNPRSGEAKAVDDLYQQLIKGPTSREEIAKQCRAAGTC